MRPRLQHPICKPCRRVPSAPNPAAADTAPEAELGMVGPVEASWDAATVPRSGDAASARGGSATRAAAGTTLEQLLLVGWTPRDCLRVRSICSSHQRRPCSLHAPHPSQAAALGPARKVPSSRPGRALKTSAGAKQRNRAPGEGPAAEVE